MKLGSFDLHLFSLNWSCNRGYFAPHLSGFYINLLYLCFRRIQWVSRQGQEDGREGHVREAVHGRDGRSDAAKSPLGRQSEGETPATLGFFKISDISARKAEY